MFNQTKGDPMGNTSILDNALAFERDEHFQDALHLFQECFADPTFDEGDLCFHCGWCLENTVKNHQSLAWYIKAAERTNIPACKLNSYFRAGLVLMKQKEFAKAADYFLYAVDYSALVDVGDETSIHAAFWYAHCLESLGRFLDALKWYAYVRVQSSELEPESRFRQMYCLIRIGSYDDALQVCWTFEEPVPSGFKSERYYELRSEAERERAALQSSLVPIAA
jgi:tetratricopeptide (TPR) repeat protein